jgi:hypothetical protein
MMDALPEKTQDSFLKVTKRIFEQMVEIWLSKRSGCLTVEIHFSSGGTSKDRCQTYFIGGKLPL